MKYFYGQEIDPDIEQKKIEKILFKYRKEPVSDDLKKRIYEELTDAKNSGKILIPFKVVMRKNAQDKQRSFIEIILDTKV